MTVGNIYRKQQLLLYYIGSPYRFTILIILTTCQILGRYAGLLGLLCVFFFTIIFYNLGFTGLLGVLYIPYTP